MYLNTNKVYIADPGLLGQAEFKDQIIALEFPSTITLDKVYIEIPVVEDFEDDLEWMECLYLYASNLEFTPEFVFATGEVLKQTVGVDSGLVAVVAQEYNWLDGRPSEEENPDWADLTNDYARAGLSLKNDDVLWGFHKAYATVTMYGDGTFPVYVLRGKDNFINAALVFLG